jgi:hypothetical protein
MTRLIRRRALKGNCEGRERESERERERDRGDLSLHSCFRWQIGIFRGMSSKGKEFFINAMKGTLSGWV